MKKITRHVVSIDNEGRRVDAHSSFLWTPNESMYVCAFESLRVCTYARISARVCFSVPSTSTISRKRYANAPIILYIIVYDVPFTRWHQPVHKRVSNAYRSYVSRWPRSKIRDLTFRSKILFLFFANESRYARNGLSTYATNVNIPGEEREEKKELEERSR